MADEVYLETRESADEIVHSEDGQAEAKPPAAQTPGILHEGNAPGAQVPATTSAAELQASARTTAASAEVTKRVGRQSQASDDDSRPDTAARFNFIRPQIDENGVSVITYESNGKDPTEDQPQMPLREQDHVMIPVRQKLTAIAGWKVARSKMEMPGLMSELGLPMDDLDMSKDKKNEISMKDLMMLCDRVAAKFGWNTKDSILRIGSETVQVEEKDGYRYTTTTGTYHSVEIVICLELPFHHPGVRKGRIEDPELPWPEHTYPKIFADTVEDDWVASLVTFENQRQLSRVLASEPWSKSTRRRKLCDFLQAKMMMQDPVLKTEAAHAIWELSLNPEHHSDISDNALLVLCHNLNLKTVELNRVAANAVWALSTTSQVRRKLVEKDVVELLYKLLHWTMKHEIVTVEEARTAHFKKVEALRLQREKEEAMRMEEEKQKMLKRRSNKTAMPILPPEPKSPEPEPTDEELQSPEMGKLERDRDALQLAVLGALNVMMIDKACRDRVLPVDPGVQTILKLCKRLKGYSDVHQRERRVVCAQLLCNMVMRDVAIRQSILPDAVSKMLSLLKETGPGAVEVCHYVSAAMQVYVLDKDAMDIVDADVSKDKEAANGVVRMFKQSLQSLHDFVGKLETGDCDTMTPHQIIVVCERMSLSLWGSAKQQSTNNKADIEFDCLSSLCHLVQRFIALQLRPEYREVEFWRVGHNLAAALTAFAINPNSCQRLMGVAEHKDLDVLDPNSACSVLMVFASPRFLEGFVRSSALTGMAFLASHALAETGEETLIGIYRKRMLATGSFPTILASMSATTDDASAANLLRCGAVTLMYLSSEAMDVAPSVAPWELFQLLALMVDSHDIRVVESLMVTLWALLRSSAARGMVREPVSQTHLDFSVQVVERVRKECITAADLRALFIQYASRGGGSQMKRSDSSVSLWGTTNKEAPGLPMGDLHSIGHQQLKKGRRQSRLEQEECGSLAEEKKAPADDVATKGSPGGDPTQVAGLPTTSPENAEKSPTQPHEIQQRRSSQRSKASAAASMRSRTSSRSTGASPEVEGEGATRGADAAEGDQHAHAQGAELTFDDAHFFGNFKPKPAKRSLNPDQWISATEHHRDKWWGIKQVFRVWDQWHEAVTLAGDPTRTAGWQPVLKFIEFMVAVLWIYLVSDDIAIPARRSHLSQKDCVAGTEHDFWWMVEVHNYHVDLAQHPLLVKALDVLLWAAALPHLRHWVARQLAVSALWNMAVRRTAVEAYLIDKGIVDVLLSIVTEVDPATTHAKWPASLRDYAGMFLGELFVEQSMVSRLKDPAAYIRRVQSAMLVLVDTGVPRLEVCGLRVLGRMTYTAPLECPNAHQFLKNCKALIVEQNGLAMMTRIINKRLKLLMQTPTYQAQSNKNTGLGGQSSSRKNLFSGRSNTSFQLPNVSTDLELDAPEESEIGTEAMLAHTFCLMRNISVSAELQVQMARCALPTLMRTSNFMTELLNGSQEPSSLQHDIMNHCSATLMNLSSHPNNRTNFYKLELQESALSEAERAQEKSLHQAPKQTYPLMPQSAPSLPPRSSPSKKPQKLPAEESEEEDYAPGTPRSQVSMSTEPESCLSFVVNKGRRAFSSHLGSRLDGALGSRDGRRIPLPNRPGSGGWFESTLPERSRAEAGASSPRESPWAPLIRAADLPHEHTHLSNRPGGGSSHGGGKALRPMKIQPRLLSASRDRHLASRNKATPGTSRKGRTAPGVLSTHSPLRPRASPQKKKDENSNDEQEEGQQGGARIGISKEEFLEWEKNTFDNKYAMLALKRVSGHRGMSSHLINMAKPPEWKMATPGLPPGRREPGMWGLFTSAHEVAIKVGEQQPDGGHQRSLPQLAATLKRPLRYLWKATDEESDTLMGNNRWAPVIREYMEVPLPKETDPNHLPAVASSLLTTPYPRYARNDLTEAKMLVESNHRERLHGDVVMQRPPTAKMRGGRKPRTMLAPKPPEPADMEEAANQPMEFALKVNLAPQRARTHISFAERHAELDPAKNRRPKLVLFEHHQGSRVYDGLFPDYQLPNGKKAFFYFESKMVEEVEVMLRAPVPPPLTLTQALQNTMPLDVDLGANTRLPGVAPEMEILKPVPSGPPLPTKHTLRVVDPQAMSSYKHFGNLEQVPLTFRVVAKPVPTYKSEVVKTPLRPPTPPPEKKVWRIEQSVFKNRAKEAEGRAFVHAKRMTDRMVGVDWARLTAKEKFIAGLHREWGDSPLTPEERMKKMEAMVSKHYMTVISIFDFYANLGGNNPYQMSLNAFSSCLEECQIPDNESPFTKKSDCDTLFIVAKSGSVEKGSKLDKVKDDNCLLRFEFIEVLIRIGVAKIGKVEQMDPADSFDKLLNTVVVPNAHPSAKVDRDTFRRDRLYCEEMDDLFTSHMFILKTIYSAYRCRPPSGGLRTKGLTLPGFLEILDKSSMMDEKFTLQEARLVFLWSRMHTSDESRDYLQYTALTFTDFLEALGRMADMKMIPTDEELEKYGWGVEGGRFKWMLAVENGDMTNAIPRRKSANGQGSIPTRPLAEKVSGLLEMLYERLYYNPQNIKPFTKDILRKMMLKQDQERGD